MKKNVHVTYRKDESVWSVKTEGTQKAAGLYETKKQAIEAGKEIAINRQSELVIHLKNGLIQDKDSYGNDPHPPKDTKH